MSATLRTALRAALIIVGCAVVVYLLFTIVFPWVDRTLITDPTLQAARSRVGALG